MNYILHFLIVIVGIFQIPFLVPIIIVRLEMLLSKKYIYRLEVYLDILEPDETDPDYFI